MTEPTRRQRLTVLAICCSSLFIVGLDATIVNLALPAVQRDLGSSLTGLQWTVDAYTLVLASLLMLADRSVEPGGVFVASAAERAAVRSGGGSAGNGTLPPDEPPEHVDRSYGLPGQAPLPVGWGGALAPAAARAPHPRGRRRGTRRHDRDPARL